MTTYDVVAVGSGHNGLVAAAYLAKAGKSVLVLEQNSYVGGGVTTRELTVPGFLHDQHSVGHTGILANPLLLNDELGLKAKHGLKYNFPKRTFVSIFEDGSSLSQMTNAEETAEEIAKFSKRDAESFRKVSAYGAKILPMMVSSFFRPPVSFGATFAMLDQSPPGRELLELLQRSAYDVVSECFENEKVRLHFLNCLSASLLSPDDRGAGVGLFFFVSMIERYGLGVPVGGSGSLSRALVDSIHANGGEVRCGVQVQKLISRGGRAVGVKTANGEEILAKDVVIGAIHPHLLGRFIDGLDPVVRARAERTPCNAGSAFTLHGALNEPLKFKADENVDDGYVVQMISGGVESFRRKFDDLRYGRVPSSPIFGTCCSSPADLTRAPAGKAVFYSWSWVPYALADGGSARWDSGYKEEYKAALIAYQSKFCRNFDSANIIAIHTDTPLDMDRSSPSFQRGDIHGCATYLRATHRPTVDMGNYTVPGVERFYLVGPFVHPGGGVYGGGRATAIRIFDDLGMDFDKAIA